MATEYAYDIELSKDKQHLTLKVELPERRLAREPILECTNDNALDIVKQDGYGNYQMVKGPRTLTNWVSREGIGGDRTGTWIFEKIVKAAAKKPALAAPAAPKQTTAKKTTAKKTTSKKTTKTTKTS